MKRQLLRIEKSGVYRALDKDGTELLIRVTGEPPFMDISQVFSLTDFINSGEAILLTSKGIESVKQNITDYSIEAITAEGIVACDEDEGIVPNIEYTSDQWQGWLIAAKGLTKENLHTKVMIDGAYSYAQASIVVDRLRTAVNIK